MTLVVLVVPCRPSPTMTCTMYDKWILVFSGVNVPKGKLVSKAHAGNVKGAVPSFHRLISTKTALVNRQPGDPRNFTSEPPCLISHEGSR